MRPNLSGIPDYYQGYINQIEGDQIVEILESNFNELKIFLNSLPVEKHEYAYAEGKWTIKEIVNHLSDGERLFQYRAMRFARNDKTELAGFDENKYTPETNANARDFQDLMSELELVRKSAISLYKSLSPEILERTGTANKIEMSVLALGFIIAGHAKHHINVIKDRYL